MSFLRVFGSKAARSSFAEAHRRNASRVLSTGARAMSTPAGVPAYLSNVPETKVTTLPSGIRVATEEGFGQSATVGVWIDAGSSYETAENNGVAHFLEHMAFKGTASRSKKDIETEIENMGGQLNAYTSREQTVYFAQAFKKDVGKVVDILGDILQNSKLDESNIEAERDVILREMQEVESNVDEVLFDRLHATAFQDSPLAHTILGPTGNIRSIGKKDLQNYIASNYSADRIVVAGSGAVNHDELCQLAEKTFSKLPKKSEHNYDNDKKPVFTGSMVTVEDTTMTDIHIAYAYEGVGWSHPDYYPIQLLQTIVGNYDRQSAFGRNVSSRLGEIVGSEDLAQRLNSFTTCYHNTGLFGTTAVTSPDKVEDLSCETLQEYVRLAHQASEAELARAKAKLKASLLMQLDSTTAIAENIGQSVLSLGRRMTPAELFLRIDEVDVAAVRKAANKYCVDVDPAIVAIGPTTNVPDYTVMRSWTWWMRS
eukprot:TRINITY_DN474_c0_g1_i1.p1 TRINITY_DN474_c0_g1~~TRINITY_DN474_c0_g1_i1.p1  ORF type:complete len:493 (-),score=149.97 TRINITY_DN474_c0_g1_i1:77-1525(-)